GRTTHELVGPFRIDAQPKRQIDGFIEFGEGRSLHRLNRLAQRIGPRLQFFYCRSHLLSHSIPSLYLNTRHRRRTHLRAANLSRPPIRFDYPCTTTPILRAVPSMILIAPSRSTALRSVNFFCAISRNCAFVIFPTLSFWGTPDPLIIPAAFFRRSDAGGVFMTKVKDRSL